MTSEIRVNKHTNRVGLGTIEYSNTGPVISGVTTASNFKTGSSNLHSSGVEVAGVNVLGADTPIGLGATIYNSGAAVFTGVVTATSFSGSNINLSGITTTTDHIHIKADNKQLKIGAHNDGDTLLYHDGNKSVLVNYTGDFHFRTNNGSRSSLEGIVLKPNGATEIYHSGNKKLETTSSGAVVTGNLDVNGSSGITISGSGADLTMNSAGAIFTGNGGNASNPIVANVSDTNTGFFYPAADTIAVTTGGGERLRITSGGDMLLGAHGSRIFDDSSGTNVVVDIYGGTTAGKRGILALGGRTGSDNADIGTIQFLNENNANATAANHVQSKLVASIDVKSETTNGNASANSGSHLIFSTKAQNAAIAERLHITSGGQVNIAGDYSQTSYVLSVTNSSNTNLFRIKTANEGDYDLRFNIQNSEAMIWHYGTDDLVFGNRYDRKLSLITNAQKRLTVSGNYIGINETSPGTYLHVKGTGEMLRLETTASGGGQCYIDFDDETATRASIGMRGSSSDTLTIAALNAGLRFDVQNATQALLINSNGCLQHGTASGVSYFTGSSEYIFGSTTSSPPAGGYESTLQVHTSKTRSAFTLAAYNNNTGGPFMTFLTSRSTTRGTLGSKVQSNDYLGSLRFAGDNATNYNTVAHGATIWARAKSTPGDGDSVIAGELHFATGTANAGSVTDNMVIQKDGQLDLKRGRVNDNGHMVYRGGGRIAGTATVSLDIPVLNDGNIYWIEAFYTHHSLSYGGYLYGVYGAYSGHNGLQINNTIGSSTAGGSNVGTWSVSRGNAGTPVVVAKSAGSYGGMGYYWIHVHAGSVPNL